VNLRLLTSILYDLLFIKYIIYLADPSLEINTFEARKEASKERPPRRLRDVLPFASEFVPALWN